MSDMCDYLEGKLIDHILRNSAYTSPTNIFVALLTADPGEAGDTTYEVSGGGYVRQLVTFDAQANGITQNTYDIEFPQASTDWGTLSHILLMDAETGGNPLFHKILKSPMQDDVFVSSLDNPVQLTHTNIIFGSEVITSADGLTTYYSGRDYTMDYANGKITVLSTGLMADATNYIANYEYANPKTITANDIFKIPVGNLKVSLA